MEKGEKLLYFWKQYVFLVKPPAAGHQGWLSPFSTVGQQGRDPAFHHRGHLRHLGPEKAGQAGFPKGAPLRSATFSGDAKEASTPQSPQSSSSGSSPLALPVLQPGL